MNREQLRALISHIAAAHGIPPLLFEAMIEVESGFRPDAVSVSGAIGLGQIIPHWHLDLIGHLARQRGLLARDEAITEEAARRLLLDPELNLTVAARILADNYRVCGYWARAVAKYHSGRCDPPPGTADGGGTLTTTHVAKVMQAWRRLELEQGGTMVPGTLVHTARLSFPLHVDIVPTSLRTQRPGIPMVPQSITWHDTGNPRAGANARMHRNWLHQGAPDGQGRRQDLSFHFVVDDREAYQLIPLNEVAWHAGDGAQGPGNRTSIAIEECIQAGRDVERTRRHMRELIALLRFELGINLVVQHNYWSGKNCPGVIRAAGPALWQQQLDGIDALLRQWQSGSAPPPGYATPDPIPGDVRTRVINGRLFAAARSRVVATREVPRRKYASPNAPEVGKPLRPGQAANVSYVVLGDDGELWYVGEGGSRMPARGFAIEP